MQLATVPELAAPLAPEVVSKTDKSITLRLKPAAQLDRKLAFQVVRLSGRVCALYSHATRCSLCMYLCCVMTEPQ